MDAWPTAVEKFDTKHYYKWAVFFTGSSYKGSNAPFEIIARMKRRRNASYKTLRREVKQAGGKRSDGFAG